MGRAAMTAACFVALIAAATAAPPEDVRFRGRDATEWGRILRKTNLFGALDAATRLAAGGEKARPLLLGLLRHDNQGVRRWAVVVLGDLGVANDVVLNQISMQSGRGMELDVRRALARLAPRDRVTDHLLAGLERRERGVSARAAARMIALAIAPDRTLAHLRAELRAPDFQRRLDALRLLTRSGATIPELQTWVAPQLDGPDTFVQVLAAEILGRARVHLDRALEVATRGLLDPRHIVRVRAWRALVAIGDKGKDASSAHVGRLDSADPDVRHAAALTLLVTGRETERARRALVERWRGRRFEAHKILANLMIEDHEGSPALVRSLAEGMASGDEETRGVLSSYLNSVARTDEALPVIVRTMTGPHRGEILNLHLALKRADPTAVVDELAKVLRSSTDARTRRTAADILFGLHAWGWRGPLPEPRLARRFPALFRAALADEAAFEPAVEGLIEAGPLASIPLLESLLASETGEAKGTIRAALGRVRDAGGK